jgi:hypothetical protein
MRSPGLTIFDVCARSCLGEPGKELLLFFVGHAASGVLDFQPEVCCATVAPFWLFRNIEFWWFVIGEIYVLPALRRSTPGTTNSNGDGLFGTVFRELDGVGTELIS